MLKSFFFSIVFFVGLSGVLLAQEEFFNTREGIWSKRLTFLRASIGFQPSAYSELGLARMKYIRGEMLGSYSCNAYYSSLEWTPTFWPDKTQNTYALKMGYSGNFLMLAYGIEAKYQTNFQKSDVVLTPKLGLGLVLFEAYYGYNISFFKQPFARIGPHQLSLAYYFNRKAYKTLKKPKKQG